MFDSTKRKLPRRRPTTQLILHRANAYNQNIQALAAKEGCGSLSRTFQIFQEGVSEFAVIPRNARGRTQTRDDEFKRARDRNEPTTNREPRENIRRYRKLLREAKDDAGRRLIKKLLTEEEQKELAAPKPSRPTARRVSPPAPMRRPRDVPLP